MTGSGASTGSAGRVAAVFAAGRLAVGVVSLVTPRGGAFWRGTAVRDQQLLGRGLGVRDVLLGAGVLRALSQGRGGPEWAWLAVASDVADGAGGALEWRRSSGAERAWVAALFALAACDAAVAMGLAGIDADDAWDAVTGLID